MILNFLSGKVSDSNNRFIYDIWKMHDSEIEDTHNFIQWIFPLNEESQAVPNSPILSENEILQISNSTIAKKNIEKSSKWYLNFLHIKAALYLVEAAFLQTILFHSTQQAALIGFMMCWRKI